MGPKKSKEAKSKENQLHILVNLGRDDWSFNP